MWYERNLVLLAATRSAGRHAGVPIPRANSAEPCFGVRWLATAWAQGACSRRRRPDATRAERRLGDGGKPPAGKRWQATALQTAWPAFASGIGTPALPGTIEMRSPWGRGRG